MFKKIRRVFKRVFKIIYVLLLGVWILVFIALCKVLPSPFYQTPQSCHSITGCFIGLPYKGVSK